MFGTQNVINAISKQGQGHSFCAFDRQFDMPHTKPRDLGHAHFGGKFFVRPLGIPHTKLHTKFEVSSSSTFRDIAL